MGQRPLPRRVRTGEAGDRRSVIGGDAGAGEWGEPRPDQRPRLRSKSRVPWPGPASTTPQRASSDDASIIAVDAPIARRAASLAPPTLRALDAIHVATALEFAPDIDAFVTYDKNSQAAAAVAAGLTVESPGQAEK